MSATHSIDLHATNGAHRVREHTDEAVQSELDGQLVARVRGYVDAAGTAEGKARLSARIAELEQESDIERVLEMNASLLAFAGTALGAFHHRRWLAIPMVVTAFLLQHALQGWCPPLAVFRRMGIRTRQEIDAERYALKLLRGDCAIDLGTDAGMAADRVLAAVAR